MLYVTSVERIGARKGVQQGIQQGVQQGPVQERFLLFCMARKRFDADVAEPSAHLASRTERARTLEDPAEARLDAAYGEAWLKALEQAAD